ncbi:cytochrome B [Lactococcus lactis]
MDEQTKYERFFVRSSMVLEKRGTISEEENRLFFSSFCMTKRKIFCPFYFYKMGRWRLRKANRHNPKGIKGESETSPLFKPHCNTRTKCFVLQCDSLQYLWIYMVYFVIMIVTE